MQWGTSEHFNDNYAQTLIDARHLIYPRQLPLRQADIMGMGYCLIILKV